MIPPVIIASGVSLALGLLMGCNTNKSTEEVIKALTQENTTLQQQIQGHLAILGISSVALAVVGSALAATLYILKKRGGK